MNPQQLQNFLSSLLANNVRLSAMIWGPPGVGKSTIVADVAEKSGIATIDVRMSQLAPTDLRGLPAVGDHPEVGDCTRWCPPDFLPRSGKGILFLDEFNMAPPVMQGVAQQLILDRRVGSYHLPDGWVVWAAGNRREDRASVFDMPAPLGNRFIHLELQPDLASFKDYAVRKKLAEKVIAFIAARPTMLHRPDPKSPAWPSPRSWEMLSQLESAGIEGECAVGKAAWLEYCTFKRICDRLPSIDRILASGGMDEPVPESLDLRFALCTALAMRARSVEEAIRAFKWVRNAFDDEWLTMFTQDLQRSMQSKGMQGLFVTAASKDPVFCTFAAACMQLKAVA